MKHGISPTTDRRVLKRRGKYIHVSRPLAIKETDWATGTLKGIVSYDPDYLAPPNVRGEVIMAPVKGLTYRRPASQEPTKGRGKRRRAARRATGSDTARRFQEESK